MLMSRARLLTSNSTEAPWIRAATSTGEYSSRPWGRMFSLSSRGTSTPRLVSRPSWSTGRTSPASPWGMNSMSWRRARFWFR
ncbi:hypothetical protein D3C78_1546800 [compost metagenome]